MLQLFLVLEKLGLEPRVYSDLGPLCLHILRSPSIAHFELPHQIGNHNRGTTGDSHLAMNQHIAKRQVLLYELMALLQFTLDVLFSVVFCLHPLVLGDAQMLYLGAQHHPFIEGWIEN